MRKKKNGQQDGGNEEDRVDIEKDDEDEVGDPDEDEDEGDLDGYGDGEDEDGDGDGGGEEDDVHVDVDNEDISEEKSVESLIEVKWSALKRQLDVKDASSSAADGLDGGGQGHLPVKKRMSRLRSNSFASGHGPSSRTSSSSHRRRRHRCWTVPPRLLSSNRRERDPSDSVPIRPVTARSRSPRRP